LKKCKAIARSVCRIYGVPQARLYRRPLGKWAAMWYEGDILLNRDKSTSTDLNTILHELSHHLHWHLSGSNYNKHEDHGPQFMACYMSIMDTVRVLPRDAFAVICERRGLRYNPPGPSVISLRKVIR
jgi:hypothetical protein